nr:putative reverse transcriptase, RNA-dependent DNA polymerase, Gag-polypeptide of LTR copia-type [Tanacetum cinerariifolium]
MGVGIESLKPSPIGCRFLGFQFTRGYSVQIILPDPTATTLMGLWFPFALVLIMGFDGFLIATCFAAGTIWMWSLWDDWAFQYNGLIMLLASGYGSLMMALDLVDNFFENKELGTESTDLPVNVIRRSSRQTKLPASLNDFIVDGKVKYGVERVINYANLSADNFYFDTSFNKSIKPSCYDDVVLDNN